MASYNSGLGMTMSRQFSRVQSLLNGLLWPERDSWAEREDGDLHTGLLAGPCGRCGQLIPRGRSICGFCGQEREFSPEEYSELVGLAHAGTAGFWTPTDPRPERQGAATDESFVVPISPRQGGLSAAKLEGANLKGLDLSAADLSAASLSGANLSQSNLCGASLSWADLERTNLSGADLTGANLSGASLRKANLSNASLAETNLENADLTGATLVGTCLCEGDQQS